MERHELDRMFDALTPDPRRERELLRQLLQDDARRKQPMKNWKRIVLGAAAAALLVTGAAAAVAPGLSQKLLDYLGVAPEDTQAVELLVPGAMAVDITKESNGATLHVSQVLRDRISAMVVVDFTAPEGTSLRLGSTNPKVITSDQGFYGEPGVFGFLDKDGERIGDGSYTGSWQILEDDDPMDNHLSALFVATQDVLFMKNAVSMRVPATTLGYSDMDEDGNFKRVEVYSGDWSFDVPLPQKDIGYIQRMNQVIGTLDEASLILEEVYVSPMALEFKLRREGGLDFGIPMDEKLESAYSRWLSIGENIQRITLTDKDGNAIPLKTWLTGTFGGIDEKSTVYQMSQITDPAKLQGGTLTLEWDFTRNSEESGSVTIPLDHLIPAEP